MQFSQQTLVSHFLLYLFARRIGYLSQLVCYECHLVVLGGGCTEGTHFMLSLSSSSVVGACSFQLLGACTLLYTYVFFINDTKTLRRIHSHLKCTRGQKPKMAQQRNIQIYKTCCTPTNVPFLFMNSKSNGGIHAHQSASYPALSTPRFNH